MDVNTLLQSYRKATGQTSSEAPTSSGIKTTSNTTSILDTYHKAVATSTQAKPTTPLIAKPKVTPTPLLKITPTQKKLTQSQLKETFEQKVTKTISSINEKLGPILNKIYTPLQYQVEEIQTGKKFKPTAGKIIGGAIEDAINAYMPVSGISLKVPSEAVKLSQRVISGVKSGATFAGLTSLIKAFKQEKIEPKELLISGGIGFWIGMSSPTMMKDLTKDAELNARKTLEDFGFKSKDFKNTEVLRSKFNKVAMELHPDKGGNAKDFQKFVEAYNKMTSAGIEPTWKLSDITTWIKNLWKDAKKTPEEKAIIKQKADADFVKLVKRVIEKAPEKASAVKLPEGEHTPQEVIGKVISSGAEKTPEGKALVKQAVEAQKQGKNVVIEKPPQPPVEGGVSGADKFYKSLTPQAQSLADEAKLYAKLYGDKGQEKFINNVLEKQKNIEAISNTQPMGILNPNSKSKSQLADFYNSATKSSVVEGGVKEEGKTTPPLSPINKVSGGGEAGKGVVKPQEVFPKAKVVSVPREQLPVGEGEKKASRLEARMKGVLGNATEEQIKDLGLSTYKTMNKAEQITKASQYVVNNQQEALNVLRGKVEPPKGIIPESIYIAMTELAKDDPTLITKLSSLQATALGQRISILSEINKNNPVRLLNEVYKVRAEVVKKRFGENATKKVVKAIKEKVKIPDKWDWNNFINSIDTC